MSTGSALASPRFLSGALRCGAARSRKDLLSGIRLINLAYRVAERLPGAYGALNIQGFANGPNDLRIIEINGRFGGGYPLAHHAGARFTDWLIDELRGTQLVRYEDWTDDLAMLRYDEAVFVPGARIRA